MSIELIVNADDFACSQSVNQGIIEAYHRGIVTSCSLLVNIATPDDIAMLKDEPNLGIGIHINLTRGMPMFDGDLGNLTNKEGQFHTLHHTGFEDIDEEAIRLEVRTQVDAALHSGLMHIDHIDTHHHAQRHRKVFDVVRDIAKEKGLMCRASDEWMVDELRASKVLCNDHFVEKFYGAGNVGTDNLISIIRGLSDGVYELMCHPGYLHTPFRMASGYVDERFTELKTLTDPNVMTVIKEAGIRLIRFADLKR